MNVVQKPPEQLEREDLIRRETLEKAACRLEQAATNTNRVYQFAWKKAAQLIRELN
jgi:hypothetical protein